MSDNEQDLLQPRTYDYPYMAQYTSLESIKLMKRRHREQQRRAREQHRREQAWLVGRRTVIYSKSKHPMTDEGIQRATDFARQQNLAVPVIVKESIERYFDETDFLLLPEDHFKSTWELVLLLQACRSHNITVKLLGPPKSFLRRLIYAWYGN